MARYTGPVCKLCRREGEKLFLKGTRCFSQKCPFERKKGYPPGEHGWVARFRRRRQSDYAHQLREKQKAKRIYGLLERQMRRFYSKAEGRPGITGENLLSLLERRLDNVVYRMGFADSRAQARQLVAHGHFSVNGRRLKAPSYLVKAEDKISVREASRKRTYFKDLAKDLDDGAVVDWLTLDPQTMSGRMLREPSRDQIDTVLNEQLIVEYYSR
ncbi:MAG: 30S ribosomal protein S4 [Anaerolineae bacterium]|nr:30S ribosomal protein S4 [Anaerolineae bacterium]